MTTAYSYPDLTTEATGNIVDLDAPLITAIQQDQNMDAFRQIMTKYKRTIFGFCFRFCGNRSDAEDLAQDIFIKVFIHLKFFRRESKFSTWLYRIAVNTCLSYVRKRSAVSNNKTGFDLDENGYDENSSNEVMDHAADPQQKLLNKELGRIIRKAVATLADKQRSVLILKDFEGKSYGEIASIMNLNEGTVKSTLFRGRFNVAKQIKEYYKS